MYKISKDYYSYSQLSFEDIPLLKAKGFDLIINNRPDDEDPDVPPAAEFAKEAARHGIAYTHIPIGVEGIRLQDIDAFIMATRNRQKVLGYCLSGTRSTMLHAMAQAKLGTPVEIIIAEAAAAGYNIAGRKLELLAVAPEDRRCLAC